MQTLVALILINLNLNFICIEICMHQNFQINEIKAKNIEKKFHISVNGFHIIYDYLLHMSKNY